MSERQTHSNPLFDWSILPPEIWTLIFRHATLVPDLTSSNLCTYDKHDPIVRRQKKAFKQSLVTRRYLIRVCKAWYSSAICFLYESLLLGRGRVLASLCEALRRSRRITTDTVLEDVPLGWWTRRIDVAMRDSTDNPNRDIDFVRDIIAMLPNLSILILDITGNCYSSKYGVSITLPSSLLQSTSPEKLNVVYCCNNHVVPWIGDWLEILSSHPHLHSISDVVLTKKLPRIRLTPDLPSLTSLYLSVTWSVRFFRQSELPNLQHLTYYIDSDPSRRCLSAESLLQKHGPKLRSLAINGLIPWMVELISETCSNLLSMELTVNNWTELSTDISTFPAVNLIKLACRQLHGKKASYSHIFSFVVKVKAMCPTLETVRLSDERNVSGLNTHPRLLRDQLKVLSAAGVALEDAEGRPFYLT